MVVLAVGDGSGKKGQTPSGPCCCLRPYVAFHSIAHRGLAALVQKEAFFFDLRAWRAAQKAKCGDEFLRTKNDEGRIA